MATWTDASDSSSSWSQRTSWTPKWSRSRALEVHLFEFQVRLRVRAVRAAHLPCCYCCRESIRACIFQLARDRCLASGFGHAMGFDSPAGQPGLEPSGPLSNPRSDLLGPRLLESISGPSRTRIVCRALVLPVIRSMRCSYGWSV